MIGNQSISKKQRMGFQPGRDMLSELPLGIIHTILALVPIRDAVRTSILSRQWRCAWASLLRLVFKEDDFIRDHCKSRHEFDNYTENAVTHVLFLHNGPIHTFELSVPSRRRGCLNIGVWLLCLSRNDIRELTIDTNCVDSSATRVLQEVPSIIYSCKKLTKLVLKCCKLDPSPTTSKAFLFLTRLFFREVNLSTNDVERLVANCALLEELTLIYCGTSELKISAPNLKVLYLLDDYTEMSVCAPLLAELSVELIDDDFVANHQQQNSSVCNYTDFIGGFTNLEKLHGAAFFPMYLSMGIESCHHTLVFHRLKEIKLTDVDFEDIKDVSVVARLILGAPNLRKLIFSGISHIYKVPYAPKVRHVSFSDFGCAPDLKLEKLSIVEMMDIAGLPPQMAFIRFLLERSPVLETMTLGGISSRKKQNLSAELEGCIKASSNVKLVILTKKKKSYCY